MIELLDNCPFCGNDFPLFHNARENNGQNIAALIECGNLKCGCTFVATTDGKAIKGWNKRT